MAGVKSKLKQAAEKAGRSMSNRRSGEVIFTFLPVRRLVLDFIEVWYL